MERLLDSPKSSFKYRQQEYNKPLLSLCRQIHFQEKDTNTVIQNMSTGKLADILKTCYLCLKYRKELVTDKKGIIAYLRAFFIPLFFIRDYGSYIIRD